MTAVICTAGVGKRLRPLTEEYPKGLVRVGEKTILEHVLDCCDNVGLHDVVLVVGHGKERVRELVGGRYRQCRVSYVENEAYATTNNIYSLWLARKYVEGGLVFFNGDIIFHPDVLERIYASEHEDSLIVDRTAILSDDAMKAHVAAGRVREVGKKLERTPTGWAMGIYRLSERGAQKYFSIAESLFEKDERNKNISFVVPLHLMAEEVALRPIYIDHLPWAEIDTQEDLEHAHRNIHDIVRA